MLAEGFRDDAHQRVGGYPGCEEFGHAVLAFTGPVGDGIVDGSGHRREHGFVGECRHEHGGKTRASALTTVCAPPSTSPKDFSDEWTMTGAPQAQVIQSCQRSCRYTVISATQLQDMPDHLARLFRLDVVNADAVPR